MSKESGNSTNSQATRRWALLGKISLVVTLLIALHTVWGWIAPSGPQLDARCSENEFVLPPDVEKALEAGRSFPNEKVALAAITNNEWMSITNFDEKSNVASSLANFFEDVKHADANFHYTDWERVTLFKIRNLGGKQADQVVLCLDENANGLAAITYDGKTEMEQVHRTLNLGSIRPSGEVSIKIWSVSSVLPSGFFFDGKATITHSVGIVKVKTSVEFYGVVAWLKDFVNFWFRHPILFVIWIVLSFLMPAVIGSLWEKFAGQDEDSPRRQKRK